MYYPSITTAIEGRVWALEEAPEPFSFETKVAGQSVGKDTCISVFFFFFVRRWLLYHIDSC